MGSKLTETKFKIRGMEGKKKLTERNVVNAETTTGPSTRKVGEQRAGNSSVRGLERIHLEFD